MDEGRKRELVMEKKLRACRVNIIPRSEDYFRSTAPPRARSTTPVAVLTPSPEAVQKASNPIALRYWNQCLEKNSDAIRFSPSPNNENETIGRGGKEEARNKINQYVTVEKIKRSQRDQRILARSASESRLRHDEDRMFRNQSSNLYSQVKAEQIKLTENRTEFQNRAVHFTGKSPQPFRRGARETRSFVPTRNFVGSDEANKNTSSMVNLNDVNQNLIPNLTNTQKMNLVEMLLENLPTQIGDHFLAERLSSLPCDRLHSVIANISEPTVNAAVPLMFPRTKDDVKLSLVLESVPKLTKLLRQN